MEDLIEYYKDKMFIVTIEDVEFTAAFRLLEKELCFEINHYGKIPYEMMRRKIDVIEGMLEDREISILNANINYFSNEQVIFKFDMILDGFLLGTKCSNKKISKFECTYHNLEKFDNYHVITLEDNKRFNVNYISDLYNLNNYKLNIIRTSEICFKNSNVSFSKKMLFKGDYSKKVDIYSVIKDIYVLRNLFNIFSKKEIEPKNIKVFYKEDIYATVFMNLVFKPIENELLINQNRFLVCFNDIKNNFEKIYQKYYKCQQEITPILQIYFDSREKEMPILNNFLSFNLMIEGFSREYYDKESFEDMVRLDLNKKNKKDVELKYRIYFLIKMVNFIFNFNDKKIIKISEKIALGRNYYIHQDKNKILNSLSRIEMLRYTAFLEDLLLANIYVRIGIDKELIKKAFDFNLFYKKDEL